MQLLRRRCVKAFMTCIMEMSIECYKEVTARIFFQRDYVDLRLMRLINVILLAKFSEF